MWIRNAKVKAESEGEGDGECEGGDEAFERGRAELGGQHRSAISPQYTVHWTLESTGDASTVEQEQVWGLALLCKMTERKKRGSATPPAGKVGALLELVLVRSGPSPVL